jgi:hypothetical protein
MMYIFLDIDGVLATSKEYDRNRHKFWSKYDLASNLKIPYPFNPECVKIFNEILSEVECEIILSSDWRLHWNLTELKQIFEFNGVKQSPIGVTSHEYVSMSFLEKNRLHEIEKYIQEHKIENYIVIDDLHLDVFMGEEKFVKTKDSQGLKEHNIKNKILEKIKKQIINNNE